MRTPYRYCKHSVGYIKAWIEEMVFVYVCIECFKRYAEPDLFVPNVNPGDNGVVSS
jgi:hypothetical protein